MKKLHHSELSGFENYKHPDTFGKLLGYKVAKIEKTKRRVETKLTIRENHLTISKKVHGGVISAFLDFACGAAAFTTLGPKDVCSTVELKVNYFRPLFLGDRLTAKSEVKFRGNRLCVVHALVYRANEKEPVAMASGTFNVVANKDNRLTLVPTTR